MPLYEYACKSCGQHLEVAQSFKDEPLTTCPACGGPLRKVFGSIGISFKGSGFYRTDSRASTRKEPAKAESGEKADTKASGDKASGDKSGDKAGDKASGDKAGDKSGDKASGEKGSSGGEKAASGSGDGSTSTAKAKTA
jgi:putative FmdB family regulatory protein